MVRKQLHSLSCMLTGACMISESEAARHPSIVDLFTHICPYARLTALLLELVLNSCSVIATRGTVRGHTSSLLPVHANAYPCISTQLNNG